ncbi:MAG: NADH-quinone oxidoreductase subunit NuoK [Chloroflexi bacterium]|nr:NADH-quinone oxidoreductase subunit NuoK [Anaerolineae bacterium]NMC02725.1 NADH-quinone oxidoreductase subunit NuoK [Chloroflexota bacterium]OQB02889.1 MAG: NADH-quinone oxidoreductase subunit K [Chloroflexi bacterium ADurb.Bin222]HOC21732.1 NADH-quinone oxidoreductase subunit NuoK [Anaerolineae bacterium]HOS80091.1 NADH-quinone oxidoreductase subunit NuoK [Anaerolineae bacterium]
MVPLSWYLILAAALFSIGLYGLLARRNLVMLLMSLELLLNAVNINLIAFSRYLEEGQVVGRVFALFVYVIAAAETALGLAIMIAVWRTRQTVAVDEIDTLKG